MHNKAKLYNFDEYKLYELYGDPFSEKILDSGTFRLWSPRRGIYVPVEKKNLTHTSWGSLEFDTKSIEEHPDVLDAAKTVYIHPDSKVSRSIIAQKYKKALNPWLADAVVIPNPEGAGVYNNAAIFINEDRKLIIAIRSYTSKEEVELFSNTKQGTTMDSMISVPVPQDLLENPRIVHVLQSQFEYFGPIMLCDFSRSYIPDILSGSLPTSKIVFDSTIMKTVGNKDNQPTFENLVNISEMLKSSDYATAGAAIKALSTMDYMNYPNSVKLVLEQNWHLWRYNKATDTTAAKYMFKYLMKGTARTRIPYNDVVISQKDYDLFIALYKHFHKDDNDTAYLHWLRDYPFMFEDINLNIQPRIRDI